MDTRGQLSKVITRNLFLSNADTWFTILVGILAKQGVRDDRLTHCSCGVTSSPQTAAIVDGVQHLIADVDLPEGECGPLANLDYVRSRFPHSNGTREPPAHGQPRRDSVLARFAFLIHQTARSQGAKNFLEEPSFFGSATTRDSFWVSLWA